jgi:hypothetical protein
MLDGTTALSCLLYNNGTPSVALYSGATGVVDGNQGNVNAVWAAIHNGVTSSVRRNDVLMDSGDVGGGTPGGITFGASSGGASPGDSDLAYLCLFDRVPTSYELTALYTWLAARTPSP